LSTYSNLRTGAFPGELYCVNPRREIVHGQKSFPDLSSLPEKVELAYVLVGTEAVMPVMEEAAAVGVENLAIIAAGFAEAGPDGREKQRQLTEFAHEHGQLVLGPNNLGFINASAKVMAFSQKMAWPLVQGGVSLVSQSGALGVASLDYFAARDVGVNCLFTLGNEAVIGVTQGMEYLLDDPDTRVIALFMEAIRDPEGFRRVAARALEVGKPVVACKIGRGGMAARSVAAHTGALVGDDNLVDAAFKQFGVIRVDSLEDLIITAGLLDHYGPLRGNRVGFVTSSGAMCGVISDLAEQEGINLPEFSPDTVEQLREVLPPFATPQNPLDTTGYVVVEPDLPQKTQKIVLDDPNLDIVILSSGLPRSESDLTPFLDTLIRGTAQSLQGARAQVLLSGFFQVDHTDFSRRYREELGMPLILPGLQKAIPALARALWWYRRLESSSLPGAPGPAPAPLSTLPPPGPWSEVHAREQLAATGVPIVPGELTDSAEAAVRAAGRLGYPVVLKAVSPSLQHKTDIGAVALDLSDADEVRSAFQRVTSAARSQTADVDGVLVTAMRKGGVELIVGVTRDLTWGPVLAVGLGGIWVEVMRDVARRLLPVNAMEIRNMLDELKASSMLRGARGEAPADLDMLSEVIYKISQTALGLGDGLDTLEVNPLRVAGTEIEALDVLVTWGEDSNQHSTTKDR
jgi:acyl-CoA synthetase (NDP forming)